ncbi:right-handed parallel beta-helix repeat-containing protein [Bartonella machadoae]|uniref:right-handed parallel beta-helix repeat-containing protein n=1 Tax=Bartonella machadoae TaxID=2893471 RepID=UPI001F4C9B9F|nr:right-handed parallel beta-helix repeat-containing protein [Bartonella machadoae]UNE53551.1 right-handed parallel beta-helix repeat-containing protein [Bartonella machadoae]
MPKKILLSCTAVVVVVLSVSGVHLNAQAKNLEISNNKKEVFNETYEIIHAKKGGKIIGKHLRIIGNKKTNTNINPYMPAIRAEGPNASIELLDGTIIKGTRSSILFGVEAKDGATLKMTGGTITTSEIGAGFYNSKSAGNKLKDVTISSSKDKNPKIIGVDAEKESNVILENVIVTKAKNGIIANNHSKVTVYGGSFEGKDTGVYAGKGSNITLTSSKKGDTQITSSSNGKGLYTDGLHSTITMTGGTVFGEAALIAVNGGRIKVTDVALKAKGDGADMGAGATSHGSNSAIELYGNTTINNKKIGLTAQNGGIMKMIGGTIIASSTGAGFYNSKSDENKLENVTISTGKEKNSGKGIFLLKESGVTLKNVKITQTGNSIIANDHSKIKISGGSFDASYATICSQSGSTITLTDNVQVTSYDEAGLYAIDKGSTITMTTGRVTGKYTALEADQGGHITVTNVTLKATNDGSGVAAGAATSGSNSVIELLGNTTISDVKIGIDAQNDSTIKMIGGTITSSEAGVQLLKNKSNNILKDVTILSSKDDALLINAIIAEKGSNITLENVTIPQAINSIVANNHSKITVAGGLFNAKGAAISALKGSTITLTDSPQITSSDNAGLYAKDAKSTITITGGTIKGKTTTLYAENGGHIKATNVTLTATDSSGTGATSQDIGSLLELYGNTKINSAVIGLHALDNGMIKMIGGTVIAKKDAFVVNNNGHIDVTDVSATAEERGIVFEKSNNNKISEINLTHTKLHIENGTGINANESIGKANLKNSEIRADVLLATKTSAKKMISFLHSMPTTPS